MTAESRQSVLFLTAITAVLLSGLTHQANAADFSKAQHVYAPPSEVRYDLDALGTNNWSFPGLDVNSTSSINPDTPGKALSGSVLSGAEGSANDPSGQIIYGSSGAAFHTPFGWSGSKNAWKKYQNSLGVSAQINKLNAKINDLRKNGHLAQAEALSRDGLRYFPNNAVLKKQFTEITTLEAEDLLKAQNFDPAGVKAREALGCTPIYKPAQVADATVIKAEGFDPTSAESRVQLADKLANDGRVLEALVEYRASLNIKSNAPAHVGLGNLYFGKGLVTEATRQYERALAIDPNCAIAYRQRGALHYILHDAVAANSDFGKAVALDPNDRLAANALVGLWKQQVALNENAVNGHLGLARAYMQTNNLEGARAEYKTVAALDPNNPALPEARQTFKFALARQQANQCLLAAKTLDGQGAISDADQKAMEGLSYWPDNTQLLLFHGQLCEKLGYYPQAHDAYMNVLRAEPNNMEAANRLRVLSSMPNSFPQTLSPMPQGYPQSIPPVAPSSIPQNMPRIMPETAPPAFAQPFTPNNQPSFPINNPTILPQASPQYNLNGPTNAPQAVPSTPSLDDLHNLFKAPLQQSTMPTSEALPQKPFADLYCTITDEELPDTFITDSDHVSTLANFASSVRTLMLCENLALATLGNKQTMYKKHWSKSTKFF